MEKKNKKNNIKKKEVCETFNVEENGEERVVESCGIEEEKVATEGQIKKQNKLFKSIILVMVGFLAFFFLILFVNYSLNHFKVDGVTFEVDTKSMLGNTLYKTSLPGIIDEDGNFTVGNYDSGNKADYRIWFRNDPRTLKEISFDGNISGLLKNVVWNQTEDYVCDGDYIGIQNLLNVYDALGIKVMKDDSASCDDLGRYTYLTILNGDETKIEQTSSTCYNLYVNNCEILPATERFLLELLREANEQLKE
jgi:hypothetical protein